MNAVIIFARYPVQGKVKTRLAETLGTEFALRFYKSLAEHVFRVCCSLPGKKYKIYIFYDTEEVRELMKKWVPPGLLLRVQEGRDLGERMKSAFDMLFKDEFNKIVIIGTDCPEINDRIILKAFEELSEYNVTIGSSNDGGYYLLGMNKFYPFLFDEIQWGGKQVLSETIKKIKVNQLSVYMLPELIDIDTEEDLRKWLSETKERNRLTDIADEYILR